MPDISKVKLPSGNVYDIKDAVAREMIAGGVSFIIAWNGSSAPDVTKIPAGVVVTYNSTDYTGTLAPSAAQAGAFYLVKSSTQTEVLDVYDEYSVIKPTTTSSSWFWEKIGDTKLDLSDLGALAYKDNVTLNKTSETVIKTLPKLTAPASAVNFSGGTTDKVLGSDATFTTTVTPTTNVLEASASGGGAAWNSKDQKTVLTGVKVTTQPTVTLSGSTTQTTGSIQFVESGSIYTDVSAEVGASSTDTFVKSYPGATQKLATTTVPNVTGNTDVSIPNVTGNTDVTIPNVTDAGSASTWSFTMGTGNEGETLIISGVNSTAPTLGTALSASKVTLGTALSASKVTLGTAKTVATGSLTSSGSGADVMTGLGTPTTASAVTGVEVTQQPVFVFDPDYKYLTASASGTAVGANGTANVIGASSTFTNTQPTVQMRLGQTGPYSSEVIIATGITSASTTPNNKDEVTAITGLGSGTTEAKTVTASGGATADVVKYSDASVTVS